MMKCSRSKASTAAASRLYCPTFKTYTEDTVAAPSEQQNNPETNSDDSQPYVTYRNPKDDKIRLAFEEAAKRLHAQGKPLFTKKD